MRPRPSRMRKRRQVEDSHASSARTTAVVAKAIPTSPSQGRARRVAAATMRYLRPRLMTRGRRRRNGEVGGSNVPILTVRPLQPAQLEDAGVLGAKM